jgi:ribosomal protein L11 methyltransferase
VSEVADGWEDAWRAFHRPVELGPLWVGPPWYEPPPGALPVVIDPGRAFGTGAHATTHLCLELLLDRPRGSLLDLGCGSGVIAIAAARLGFAPVLALDLDPVAVEVTIENARVNGVEIGVSEADARTCDVPVTDLTVANIALTAVQVLGPRLSSRAVITSGYVGSDRPELSAYDHSERREREGWAADLFERRAT